MLKLLLITCIFVSSMIHSHVSAANMLRNIDSMSELNTIGDENPNKLIVLFANTGNYTPFDEFEKKLSGMAAEFRDVVFLKADIDKHREFLVPLPIKSNPEFFFMKNGKTLETSSEMDENKIRNLVKKNGQGTAQAREKKSDDVEKEALVTEEARDNSNKQDNFEQKDIDYEAKRNNSRQEKPDKFEQEDRDNEPKRDKSRKQENPVRIIATPKELTEIRKSNAERLVVIDFYTDPCGPCTKFAPVYEKLVAKYTDVVFLKVNANKSPNLKSKFRVDTYPTFIFMKKGKKQISAGPDEQKLRQLFKQYG